MRFSKINILTTNALFFLALIGLLAFMNFECCEKIGEVSKLVIIFIFLCDLLMLGFLIWGLTSKISISDNGIRYKSIFKDITIEWTQIKSYGIFVTGSNVKYVLERKDYDKFILAGQKNIFITDNEEFTPAMFKIRHERGHIYFDFHYRKEVIQFIDKKMKS
jgi:hypothetical protein